MTSEYCQITDCTGKWGLTGKEGKIKELQDWILTKVEKKMHIESTSVKIYVNWQPPSDSDPFKTKKCEVCLYREILIVNTKPLPEVSEHEGAVLLEFEMARHVLPANTETKQIRKHKEHQSSAGASLKCDSL